MWQISGGILKISESSYSLSKTALDKSKDSWTGYMFFFAGKSSSGTITKSYSSKTTDAGTLSGYLVKHQKDNWGENYVDTRYEIKEEELYNDEVGVIYSYTYKYTDFLDCWYCPVYIKEMKIELKGYYIELADGTIKTGGSGYNISNPYGGNNGLITFFNKGDFGIVSFYISDEYSGYTENNYSDVECGGTEGLTIARPAGIYSFYATSNSLRWEGTLNFLEGTCNALALINSN